VRLSSISVGATPHAAGPPPFSTGSAAITGTLLPAPGSAAASLRNIDFATPTGLATAFAALEVAPKAGAPLARRCR